MLADAAEAASLASDALGAAAAYGAIANIDTAGAFSEEVAAAELGSLVFGAVEVAADLAAGNDYGAAVAGVKLAVGVVSNTGLERIAGGISPYAGEYVHRAAASIGDRVAEAIAGALGCHL